MVLILCLMTVSRVYCQETDSLKVTRERALELISTEIKYKQSLAVDSQQVAQIYNLQIQYNFCEEKVGECLIAKDQLKEANQFAVSEIDKKDKKIDDQDKKIKNNKLASNIIRPVAVASLVLNAILLLTR